ncbi:MAG: hypothetical protein HC927_01975 [Deltaproteobacteria bacterium]|nr:hypothetical protein [Deltaproteobacteria bacterium]
MLSTYSLDLEAVLALPLAVLSQGDMSIEELLRDPLWLIEGLREAGSRVHVFVDAAAMTIPRNARNLYAFLEPSVHPVRAPNGGAFHPKVWVARFTGNAGVLLRVAVLSRNLTFDRSWDVALATEGIPANKQRAASSRGLAAFLRVLPDLSVEALTPELAGMIGEIADEVERTRFPSPQGLGDAVDFEALGIDAKAQRARLWRPRPDGARLLAIAPFANKTALNLLAGITAGERILVSRQETLDELAEETLDGWSAMVLCDGAVDETQDEDHSPPSGLHAKLLAIEHGREVSWWIGSANLTAAAFTGTNVEMMVRLTAARKDRGINRFMEAGFSKLCEPYRRRDVCLEPQAVEARSRLEQARAALVGAELLVRCRASDEGWEWTLTGAVSLPPGVAVTHWPLSIDESHARELDLPAAWNLPLVRLTCFVAFRISACDVDTDDIRIVLKLPVNGLPADHTAHILRGLIDSPERFLQFLRALLGGLEGLGLAWLDGEQVGAEKRGNWGSDWTSDALLEDLVRAASRGPARLGAIRRLVSDLRVTEEGRRIVTEEFIEIWDVIERALEIYHEAT